MRIGPSDVRHLLVALLLVAAPAVSAQAGAPSPPAPPSALPDDRDVFTEDHVVPAGQRVDDVVVVGADLRVLGTVAGDAVVVGGKLIVEESGVIEGDATVTGGTIVTNGGRILGEMRTMDAPVGVGARGGGESMREGIADMRREMTTERRRERAEGRDEPWYASVRDGMAGLVSTMAVGLVLATLGALLIFYGRPYLETVSDTLRAATLRSGAVGLAVTFLIVPAFVVMILALVVSIIGIPLLLIAIPLYPVALAAAAGFGLLAAAHAIGERTTEQRAQAFDFRRRNAYGYLFTGLGLVFTPLLLADLLKMTGFLHFLGVILSVAAVVTIWVIATFGVGAVILSRAGTQRTFAAPELDDPLLDRDPLFDPDPASHG